MPTIEEIEKKIDQLKAQKQKIKMKETQKERKETTRLKILAGAFVLDDIKNSSRNKEVFQQAIGEFLLRGNVMKATKTKNIKLFAGTFGKIWVDNLLSRVPEDQPAPEKLNETDR